MTDIGKIRIKWKVKNRLIKERLLEHYQGFLSNERKDIELEVKDSPFCLPQRISLLIKTRSWSYFKNKDKIYFHFPRNKNDSVAIISQDFKKIDFFLSGTSGQLLLYLFPELLYSLILSEFNGILLHACGVKVKDKIFIFVAPAEGGKSTLAKLALKKNFIVLNDDRIILRKIKNKIVAFGNPWHGEVRKTSPTFGEIKEICFLEQAHKNYLTEIDKSKMFFNLLRNTFYFKEDKEYQKKVVENIFEIMDNIKGYTLGFKPDTKIWRFLNGRFG